MVAQCIRIVKVIWIFRPPESELSTLADVEVRAELTIEPFVEGSPGDHVLAAIEALRPAQPDVGPFATTVVGDVEAIGQLVRDALVAAFTHGATGATVSLHRTATLSTDGHEFVAALRPVLRTLGLHFAEVGEAGPLDVPIEWRGEHIGFVGQLPVDPNVQDGLVKLIALVEAEFGRPLAELDRTQKQQALRSLDQHGAFTLRNAVDVIADAFSVSRATLYNYLRSNRNLS